MDRNIGFRSSRTLGCLLWSGDDVHAYARTYVHYAVPAAAARDAHRQLHSGVDIERRQ